MSDYFYSIAGRATSAAAQMVMLLVLTALVSANDLAILLAVYSLAAIVAALGDIGLGTLAARERSYGIPSKADNAIRLADRLAVVISLTASVLLIGLSNVNGALLSCVPLLVWAPIERATETRALRLIADGKVVKVAFLAGGRRIIGLGGFVALCLVIDAKWAFTISLAVSAIVAQILVKTWVPLTSCSSYSSRGLLREALPFTFTSISGQMRNLDVPIITALIGGPPAAAYGLGARFASPVMLIFSSLSSLILVRARKFTAPQLNRLVISLISAGGGVAVSLVVLAPHLTRFASQFVSWIGVAEMRILAMVTASYIFAGVGIILGSICVAFHLQNELVRVNIATTVVSLASVSLLAVTTGSAISSAITSTICYMLQAVILIGVIKKSARNTDG